MTSLPIPLPVTKRLLTAIEASLPFTREQLRTVAEHVPLDEYLTYWTAAAKEHIHKEAGLLPAVAERNLDIMLEFYLGGILNAYLYCSVTAATCPSMNYWH